MGDNAFDDLLAGAKAGDPVPSAALMARVLADATRLQPALAAPPRRPAVRGFFASLIAAIGGGGALAGLATATATGLWIGVAQPAPFAVLTGAIWAGPEDVSVDLIPDLEGMLSDADG